MRVLVLQHIPLEHPGSWRSFMDADAIRWDTIELDAGGAIPDLADYDALLVMGGPMDVWEEDRYPWLKAEKAAIRDWVGGRRRPLIGICLGHQLLADALGGRVEPMMQPEVGMREVVLTPAATADPLFVGLPSPLLCLQWHGSAVTRLPENATLLAGNDACPVQAFRTGQSAYGIQFHVEVTPETVPEWGRVPAYEAALEAVLGPGAQRRLATETAAGLNKLTANARKMFMNLKTLI